MEFRVGNTFGSTLHCSYGAFWLSFAMFLIPSLGIHEAYAGDQRAFTVAVGIFLMAWCLLTLVFTIGALKTNITILFVLGCLTLAFFFLALAQFIAVPHPSAAIKVNRAGGAFAIFCALGALYAGASGIMLPESTWVRFPLGEFSFAEPTPAATAQNGSNGKHNA
jgi:succinate-acetate transporter protein